MARGKGRNAEPEFEPDTDEAPDPGPCPLCDRPMRPGGAVTEHHLVPRVFRGRETVTLHRVCHDKIHAVLRDRDLRDEFHTVERLRTHPEIARFVGWVASKDPDFVDAHHTTSGKRRGR